MPKGKGYGMGKMGRNPKGGMNKAMAGKKMSYSKPMMSNDKSFAANPSTSESKMMGGKRKM